MPKTIFSINGRLVPEAQAVVPVTDRGFLYGDGLFETLHAYGPRLFRMNMHLDRLLHGVDVLAIAGVPPRRTLARWLQDAVAAASFRESNVRLTLTRGSGPRGPSIRGPFKPSVVIMVSLNHRRPARDYTKGVSAIIATMRRQEASVVANLKTTCYIEQIFARREADAAGVDEALLLNNAGLLCEGSASNITLVKDGTLFAPDPKLAGALPGTAQLVVLELAGNLGIPVYRVSLSPFDLRDCDEAFLSATLREITPLVRVGENKIGGGKPGPVTRKLMAAYRKLVEKECRFKFKALR